MLPLHIRLVLLTLGALLGLVVVFSSGGFSALAGSVALLFLLLAVQRMDLLVVAIAWLYFSTFRLPGLPGGRQLHEVLMLVVFCLGIGRQILRRQLRLLTPSFFWPAAFMVILGVLAATRGIGFQSLSDSLWGGGRYLVLFPPLLLLLVADQLRLSPRQWRVALTGLFLMALLPGAVELLYRVAGTGVLWLYNVIRPSSEMIQAYRFENPEQMSRFRAFIPAAQVLLLPFVLGPCRGRRVLLYGGGMAMALGAAAWSGHRLVLLEVVLFLGAYAFLKIRGRLFWFAIYAVVGVLAWLLLNEVAASLPHNIQRILTLIPGMELTESAYSDAQGTTVWRIEVWREALREIPKYLWLGKGFCYDSYAYLWAMENGWRSLEHSVEWALVATAYHQGVLSLLIGMGIPGLIAGLGLLIMSSRLAWRCVRVPVESPLGRMREVLALSLLVKVFIYLLVYGDVYVSFMDILFFTALVRGLDNAVRAEEEAAAEI